MTETVIQGHLQKLRGRTDEYLRCPSILLTITTTHRTGSHKIEVTEIITCDIVD